MPDYTGQQFGSYRLLYLVGSGGFADVYLGEHTRLGMKAALKILHTHLMAEDSELFLREARTIADLRHAHIVRVLDFDLRQGLPFLVLEYAPHGSLAQRHPRGSRVPLDQVVHYVRQMAQALQYAHDHRIIHRDVKPANMLIGDQDILLLSDFGIATIAHATSSMHEAPSQGTLAYMAPEQLQGKPRPASDQYALAVTVYQWLTGELPFQGSSTEVIAQHLSAAPPSLRSRVPDLPEEVERVVLTALAKDPAARFSDVQSFASALAQASQHSPSSPALMRSVDSVPPAHPPLVRADANHTVPMPPTNSVGALPSAQDVPMPGATQPMVQTSPSASAAEPATRPVPPVQTASKKWLASTTLLGIGSALIIPLFLLLTRFSVPDVNNNWFFTLNALYCFGLGWQIAKRSGKFQQTLLLSFVAILALFLAHWLEVGLYEVRNKQLLTVSSAFYLLLIWMGIAIALGIIGHGTGWLQARYVQWRRKKATESVERLAAGQRLGELVISFSTSKQSKRAPLNIGVVLLIWVCTIVALSIFHFFINYVFILILLVAWQIVSDIFRKFPTEKIYLYSGGLITPTSDGLLALHWNEISHMPSPHVLICHGGTQVMLPEVTEDFQQLHAIIQQQIAHTQPQQTSMISPTP